MQAAIVEAFDRSPRYGSFADPVAEAGEVIIDVQAAALAQLVRLQASGKHYTAGTPPFVPGVDGVGLSPDHRRLYFAFPRQPFGAMAERVAVRSDYTVPVPDSVDTVTAAAIANPGMSSWVALTRRTFLKPGEAVLVIGATGTSGRLAIQIAKHLGAGRVVAASRQPTSEPELRRLGADAFVTLSKPAAELTADFRAAIADGIDIVLDYAWGSAAEAFLAAATGHGKGEAAPRIRFVNIGSLGGHSITLSAAAVRSSGVEILGSGLGSASHAAILESIGELFAAVSPAGLKIATEVRPLADVETAWQHPSPARLVLNVKRRANHR